MDWTHKDSIKIFFWFHSSYKDKISYSWFVHFWQKPFVSFEKRIFRLKNYIWKAESKFLFVKTKYRQSITKCLVNSPAVWCKQWMQLCCPILGINWGPSPEFVLIDPLVNIRQQWRSCVSSPSWSPWSPWHQRPLLRTLRPSRLRPTGQWKY